jgi:hypothetical protein
VDEHVWWVDQQHLAVDRVVAGLFPDEARADAVEGGVGYDG